MQRTQHADPIDERIDFFFTARSWTGEPRIVEPDKAADLRWCPLDALPDPVVPHERYALHAWSATPPCRRTRRSASDAARGSIRGGVPLHHERPRTPTTPASASPPPTRAAPRALPAAWASAPNGWGPPAPARRAPTACARPITTSRPATSHPSSTPVGSRRSPSASHPRRPRTLTTWGGRRGDSPDGSPGDAGKPSLPWAYTPREVEDSPASPGRPPGPQPQAGAAGSGAGTPRPACPSPTGAAGAEVRASHASPARVRRTAEGRPVGDEVVRRGVGDLHGHHVAGADRVILDAREVGGEVHQPVVAARDPTAGGWRRPCGPRPRTTISSTRATDERSCSPSRRPRRRPRRAARSGP